LKGFGDGKRAFFWLKEGKPDPQAVHVGFVAKDHAEVDAFFKAAVDAGGKSKKAPQAENKATVQVLAPGGCYGAYGDFDHAVPSGTFTLAGTYTQLIGAYPGSIQHTAEYAGTIVGNVMTLSISVPALQQTIGPFRLTAGVTSAWSACLYP
jgi:hypothetical protein